MIKITFLGTSDAIPSVKRNHTAILLSYKEENILIDCGEGTQRQFKHAGISPSKVTRLLISHWHGDHVLGIPGLLQTLALGDHKKTLYIYGPRGTKKYMKEMFRTFHFFNKLSIKVFEIEKEGKFFETKDFFISAKKLRHGPHCLAYSFIKKGGLKIDKKKLEKSKLPNGPILQNLKNGKDITHNGKKYYAKSLTYREGDKKISIVLDTRYEKDIAPFVKNSDLLISESSFSNELKEKAKEHEHLTASQAGEIAKSAKVKKLILTHLSQRYEKNPEVILNEAKKVFKNSHLARDLEVVEV